MIKIFLILIGVSLTVPVILWSIFKAVKPIAQEWNDFTTSITPKKRRKVKK